MLLITREKAQQWNIDPDKIIFIGFSAGATHCASLANRWNESILQDYFNYPKEKILKIAICGDHSGTPQGEITTPCGNCRQALLEYECTQGSPITVFCASTQGKVLEIGSIKNLLPFCFELLYKPS